MALAYKVAALGWANETITKELLGYKGGLGQMKSVRADHSLGFCNYGGKHVYSLRIARQDCDRNEGAWLI